MRIISSKNPKILKLGKTAQDKTLERAGSKNLDHFGGFRDIGAKKSSGLRFDPVAIVIIELNLHLEIKMKQKVLFLCTGNSCRSQMAEGLLRHIGGSHFEAYSAGTKPSFVNPKAIQAMQELGLDISTHQSQSVDEFLDTGIDWVISVCDNAKESCPVFPGEVQRLHHSFFDPADAEGTDEEVLAVFRKVRNEIESYIQDFVKNNQA